MAPGINRQLVADQAIAQVRSWVLEGRYSPGERLREEKIAGALGISRATLREAFYHLQAEGILTRRSNLGTYVREFTNKQARDLFQVRLALEPLGARMAVTHISAESLDKLGSIVEDIEQSASDGDTLRTLQLDAEFHVLILEASGNDTLAELAQSLSGRLRLFVLQTGPAIYQDDLRPISEDHANIVRAFDRKDADGAEAILRSHIEIAQAKLLNACESSPSDYD